MSEPTPEPKAPEPERKFTQEEVNALLADNKRNLKTQLAELEEKVKSVSEIEEKLKLAETAKKEQEAIAEKFKAEAEATATKLATATKYSFSEKELALLGDDPTKFEEKAKAITEIKTSTTVKLPSQGEEKKVISL